MYDEPEGEIMVLSGITIVLVQFSADEQLKREIITNSSSYYF